jgi:hypothetical protein
MKVQHPAHLRSDMLLARGAPGNLTLDEAAPGVETGALCDDLSSSRVVRLHHDSGR